MKAAQLRQSILQAAVQGKLVQQNVHDEPASILLDRIAQKREKLLESEYPNADEARIQQLKQKKQTIPDDVSDLPDGWKWATLMQCSGLVVDCHNKTAPYSKSGIPLMRTSNVRNGKFQPEGLKFVTENTFERWSARCIPEAGDIIITREAPMGEVCMLPQNIRVCLGQRLMLIRLMPETIVPKFILFFLQNPNLMEYVQDKPVGLTVQHLRVGGVETMLIPIPPLAEQQRIVAKVDELMTLCDELEAAEKELDALESRFAEYLPKSILQAAVQGKLVPQNVHDEPVVELLKRIQQEKAQLVREGKIKKEKPLPPIAEDEIPYDLPDGWMWCRLGGVVSLLEGEKASGNPLPYLEAKVLRGQKTPAIVDEGKFIKEGTKLILVDGENSGEVFISPMEGYMGSTFKVLHIVEALWLPFILRFIELHKDLLRNSKKGAAIPHLNKDIFFHLPLPLPPLAEQQRIVAKVDELMALCDELKAAKDISVKRTASNIVPFPQQGEDKLEIGIAARGEMQGLSDEAVRDIKEMFGDDCNS